MFTETFVFLSIIFVYIHFQSFHSLNEVFFHLINNLVKGQRINLVRLINILEKKENIKSTSQEM